MLIKLRPSKLLLTTLKLTLSASLATLPWQASHAQTVLKLAHAGALSAKRDGFYGKDSENGAMLAIEDLNARQFSIAGQPVRFELLTEDDSDDPKLAVAAAQRLVAAGARGIVGHSHTETSIAAAKIYAEAGIPQISPSAVRAAYTRQGYATAFRMIANEDVLATKLGMALSRGSKQQKAVVISDGTSIGEETARTFRQTIEGNGISIVGTLTIPINPDSYTSYLKQIKESKPDLIFYGGRDIGAGNILAEMTKMGIETRFVGTDRVCTSELPALAQYTFQDYQVICGLPGGIDTKQMQEFNKRYKTRFGVNSTKYAPIAYDAVMSLATAMQAAKSAEPAQYLPHLAALEYEGLMGSIAFDPKGDLLQPPITVVSFANKRMVRLSVVK